MNCQDFEELLSAYADGELPKTQKDFVEEHLTNCRECRAVLADFETAGGLLSALSKMPETVDILRPTLISIKEKGRLGSMSGGWRRPLAVGIPLLVLIIVLLAVQPWNTQTPSVLAADIVRNSPEMKEFLDNEQIQNVEVATSIIGREGDVLVVLVKTISGAAAAEVDLDKKLVTDIVRIPVPGLTSVDESSVVDLAESFPEIQALLARGARFGKVTIEHLVDILEHAGPDGNPVKEGRVQTIARISVRVGGELYLAIIDVGDGILLSLEKPEQSDETDGRTRNVIIVASILGFSGITAAIIIVKRKMKHHREV